MKGILLVALLMAGCVLTSAKTDRKTLSYPTKPSANINPVIVELKNTRQASVLEPPILIADQPTQSEPSKQTPHKNKVTKEPRVSVATKPAWMEPSKPKVEVPVRREEVPVRPEEVPVRPEDVPARPEEVPAIPEEVPTIPEVPAIDVETAIFDDPEVFPSQPFGQEPAQNVQYSLPEDVRLSPKQGDTPEDFIRDELVIPGGNAGNSNDQSGDMAELRIVYTVENSPAGDPNITWVHETATSQTARSGYSEDQATCPAPKKAK